MKHLFYTIIALFLMASCQQEELPQEENAVGYLVLENLFLSVNNVSCVPTKAVDSDLYVEIVDNVTYAPGKVPSSIKLTPGTYTLRVYNSKTCQSNKPWYLAEEQISIEAGEVNHVSIKVPLKNVGVRLSLPADFDDLFSYTFSVSQGDESKQIENGETCYFESVTNGPISYSLAGTNADDEPITGSNASGSISNAANGNIYVITYNYPTKSLSLQE